MSLPPLNDTIAAIATARGAAAIGVVRLSGPQSLAIASDLFRPHSGRSVAALKPGTFSVGMFQQHGELIDEGLLLVFADGRSYTGQEACELQVHGSGAVLRRLLDACLEAGARQAGPGEFTLRAYLDGRMDLAQAESVLELINAEGERGRRNSLAGLGGELSRRIDKLQTGLTAVYGSLQAALDYPDEGVPESLFSEPLSVALQEIDGLLLGAHAGRIASRGARLALAGRPNSGKSSLLNALLGYERSIVSNVPGTTRDYLEAQLEVAGIPITLVDTAGLRHSEDEIEQQGVAASRTVAAAADLVLVLLDPQQDSAGDAETLELLASAPEERRIVLWSKADLGLPVAAGLAGLAVSSLTGTGLDRLLDLIEARLLAGAPSDGIWVSNERHAEALRRAEGSLESALAATEDLAALDVADALAALSEVTGRTDIASETIEHIFANFCVGK